MITATLTPEKILSPELLHKIDAYWRAANYLAVGQIYLYDNPLLKEPLKLRIAETLQVLFFMTLAILIFNFYLLTTVMIVMLALLNIKLLAYRFIDPIKTGALSKRPQKQIKAIRR